jgi:hypothetical protein
MEVKGKLQHSPTEYIDCVINVRYGKLNEVIVPNVSAIILSSLGVRQTSDYIFEKHYDINKAPYRSNYLIRYYGGSEVQKIIYLKLNPIQAIRLKLAMRKYLIQSEDMKKDILKYIVGGILGFLGSLILQHLGIFEKESKNSPKTEIHQPKSNR